MRLIRSEFVKLFSTRLWLWLLLAAMALTALYACLNIWANEDRDTLAPPLSSAAGQRLLFALGAGGAQTFVAILAAIGLTSEFRHGTATATFLATPQRGRIVAAKLVTYGLVGVGYGAACTAVVAAIGLPWLAQRGITVPLTGNGIPATTAGALAAVGIFALLGVGLGALLRDQVAAVATLLIYLFVIEPIVTNIPALSTFTIYLPGSAANALTQVRLTDREFLQPWQGGLLLAFYAIVAVAAGTYLVNRRDIT